MTDIAPQVPRASEFQPYLNPGDSAVQIDHRIEFKHRIRRVTPHTPPPAPVTP